jgi:hypothetical protein
MPSVELYIAKAEQEKDLVQKYETYVGRSSNTTIRILNAHSEDSKAIVQHGAVNRSYRRPSLNFRKVFCVSPPTKQKHWARGTIGVRDDGSI